MKRNNKSISNSSQMNNNPIPGSLKWGFKLFHTAFSSRNSIHLFNHLKNVIFFIDFQLNHFLLNCAKRKTPLEFLVEKKHDINFPLPVPCPVRLNGFFFYYILNRRTCKNHVQSFLSINSRKDEKGVNLFSISKLRRFFIKSGGWTIQWNYSTYKFIAVFFEWNWWIIKHIQYHFDDMLCYELRPIRYFISTFIFVCREPKMSKQKHGVNRLEFQVIRMRMNMYMKLVIYKKKKWNNLITYIEFYLHVLHTKKENGLKKIKWAQDITECDHTWKKW